MKELEETKAARGIITTLAHGHPIHGTRFTYLRAYAPGTRRGKSRARALVQCSCGVEKVVYVEDLTRTHGCSSKSCRARWETVLAFRPKLEAFLEGFLRSG